MPKCPSYVLTVTLTVLSALARGQEDDVCARLTRAEAETVLGMEVGEGRRAERDLATECSYESLGEKTRRMVLTLSLYQTGRAGLRGSAADYFVEVRRASMHMRLPMQPVGIGDEAYWMGGVLHVRKGQDLSLAIEIVGMPKAGTGSDEERARELSAKAAAIVLGKLEASASAPETLTIATNTQAHRKDLGIAVGNIWEESYTPEDGAPRRGLTAMLDMVASQDASQHRRVRVYPGQVLRVFGYVLRIVSIERSGVRLTLEREPPPREN